MAYRRPSITVIQEFQNAAAALALPTLPACVVGPGYQISDDANCGIYSGVASTYAYVGLVGGGVVDLTAPPTAAAELNVYKGVGLKLSSVYLVNLSGAGGIALTTGRIDIGVLGKTTFADPTASRFAGFDPSISGAPNFYVEITGGTGLNAADLGRKFVVSKTDDNHLKVATEFVSGTNITDVNYRILEFRATEIIPASSFAAKFIVPSATGVALPINLTSVTDLTPKYIVEANVLLSWRALRPDLAGSINAFTDTDSLKAIFGVNGVVPENIGCYAVNLALQNTTTSVSFTGLGADFFTDEEVSWQTALEFLESKDVYALAVLTHNTAVHQTAKSHVEGMSVPAVGRERVCFVSRKLNSIAVVTPPSGLGYAAGGALTSSPATTFRTFRDTDSTFITDHVQVGYFVEFQTVTVGGVGVLTGAQQTYLLTTRHKIATIDSENQITLVSDPTNGAVLTLTLTAMNYRITRDLTRDEEASFIAGYSSSLASRRVVHTWPDILAVSVNAVATKVPGYFAGAVLAGMTAGLPSQAGFTNLSLVGFVGRENSDDRYTDTQLDVIAGGGTLILDQPVEGAALGVRHQLTTDVSTIFFQEFSVTKNVDLIARFFRGLYAPFIGIYNITEALLDMMKTRGEGGLTFLKQQRAPRVGAPIRSGSLTRIEESLTQPDSVEVDIDVNVPLPLNHVTVTLLV